MRHRSEFKEEEKHRLLSLFRTSFKGVVIDNIEMVYKSYQMTDREREYLYHLIKQQIERVHRRRIGKV